MPISTKLIDILNYPVNTALKTLLSDKSAKGNIIFATEAYGTKPTTQITEDWLKSNPQSIQPRVSKSPETQQERTRKAGEVFTPSWICNKMNNYCDAEWFGGKNVFNTETARNWEPTKEPITFNTEDAWKQYIDSKRLEITCGEAPFLVSRYDTATGELIEINRRIGILDRKMRVINENTTCEQDWLFWTLRAFQSVYGYEFQGDNLLIARINLLNTFAEYLQDRWHRNATESELQEIANILRWNIWQMNGLTGIIPFGKDEEKNVQLSFEDLFEKKPEPQKTDCRPPIECKIYDWHKKQEIIYNSLKKGYTTMKFDFCIGNPPYQQESKGANANDTPVYHYFYIESFKVADKVELISPARFLFKAGGTPKDWNEQMLTDTHFKVLKFVQNSAELFPNTDITGGIAISYRDAKKNFGSISVFSPFPELNSIREKVHCISNESLSSIMTNRGIYRYSDKAYIDQPEEMKKTADRRIAPSAFERMPKLFTEEKPNDGQIYIQIYGNLKNNERVYRWFRKDYVEPVVNLNKYKVMIPKANGSGAIGEKVCTPLIGTPLLASPLIGFTETYISIGETDSSKEAESILKYVKSKFARTMLGILKITQNNAKPTWLEVPLQDFTSNSDIDWSKSIKEIDKQLYAKYGLSNEEIAFIESHVKEME